MDLPIVELLRKAREEAYAEGEGITEIERARRYITRIRREISGE